MLCEKMEYLIRIILFSFFGVIANLTLNAKEIVININRTEHKPVIDGVLDDSTWLNIEPITAFMQYWPVEGKPPTERTELYIAYDDDNFYLAFKCYDSEIHDIMATMTQRESWDNNDCVGFAFDTDNNEQDGFLFNINPYGIPSDFIWHYDGYTDNGWDADLKSKGKIFSDCYIVEVAIPFKSLRMPAKDEQEWGFYALRSIKHKGEFVVWPSRTRKIPNLLAQASLLKGIRGIETGRNFVLIPYVFSSYIRDTLEEGRPFDLGTDLRYGITSDIMLDVTFNPDYSQIEADPDRIELTERYTQWLPEKRPFFTEGTDIFASNQALFYSRSIKNPIAGAKLTGKIGTYRMGLLSAMDEEIDSKKKIYYNHFRIKTKILNESNIGFLTINKDNFADNSYNRVVSLDGVFRFKRIYSLKPQVSKSFTKDTTGNIEATGYNLIIERLGAHTYNSIWYSDFPEDFDAQSGSMWQVLGFREIGTHNDLFIRKPFEKINEISFHGGLKGRFNFNNDLTEDYLWVLTELSLNKFWSKLEFFKNHEFYNNLDFRYSGFEYELWNMPTRYYEHYLSVIWGGAVNYYEGYTGWRIRLFYSVTVKPVQRIVYNINISREDFYHEYRGERAYLQTIVWNKLSYQIIPSMFLRGIYQYNSLDKTSNASLLFAFEYSPLSNIYVGTNLNDFSTVEQLTDNVEVFAKIGYLWRL